jgi:hypothetical protein
MKIYTLVLAVLTLSSCASLGDSIGVCRVFQDHGGLSTPIGLIRLPPEIDSSLRQQLPAVDRDRFVCWYTSGDRLIVSERNNHDSFIYAYTYLKQDGSWLLSDASPKILALPRAIN